MTEIASYTSIDLPILKENGVLLTVKREELLFPEISGNKYRKLKYNLEAAKAAKQQTLLTFGGGFSNHIAATAFAGKIHGFKTIGVIRGEELSSKPLNPTLSQAVANGMQLHFISRAAYRTKEQDTFLKSLHAAFGDFYLLPEGGTNALAVKGCGEIINILDKPYSHLAAAVGTGGTLAGISNGAFPGQEVIGFPALKGDFLQKDICNFTQANNWRLQTGYEFGGYAKINAALVAFVNEFYEKTGVALDPVYTAKAVYGIVDMATKGFFPPSSHILMIHTGGLQAKAGMNEKLMKKGKVLLL